jgi:flagellar hook-associated protein 2
MGSGLDINSLITKLMGVERQPLNKLQSRQAAWKQQLSAIDGIAARLNDVSSLAQSLSNPSKWGTTKASSSDTTVAAVANTGQGSSGTVGFTVSKLASAHGLRSTSTLSATSAQAATAGITAVIGRGLDLLGISSASGASGIATGKLDVAVSRASAAATHVSSALAGSVTINGSNNTLQFSANGVAHSVTLANGTYDQTSLVSALNTALTSTGVAASASGSGIALSTTLEGSAASLQVTGGTALAGLGLSTDPAALSGSDGAVSIGGVETIITSAQAGTSVSVAAPSGGSMTLTLSGGLRTGSGVAAAFSTGDGSLSAITDAVNSIKSQTGITAAAVRVGTSSFRLQLTSLATGSNSKIGLHAATFSPLGSMLESSTASDAEITIGSGPGAYTATSSQNKFSDLIAGTTITVQKLGAATVTSESDSRVSEVADLVAKTNTVLGFINQQAKASATAPGVLSGDASVRRFAEQIRRSVLSASSTVRAGVSVDRSGTLTFDKAAYETAYAADPEGVKGLFAQSATFSGGSFLQAADRTQSGSYAVVLSQAPTRAFATVSSWSGALSFSQGATTASFSSSPSASASDTAAALNTFFTNNGFGLAAAVDGANVSVTASAWGTDGTFSLNSTSYSGSNAQGTIDGQVATGAGRNLYLPTTAASSAAGLRLTITATSAGSLGNVEYKTGIAGALRLLAVTSTENASPLRAAKATRESRIKTTDSQITALERRLKNTEANLRRQYSTLDSNMGQLQNTSSWLSQQSARSNNN